MSSKNAVFLGNLRADIRVRFLKQLIIELLKLIGVEVEKHAIEIIYQDEQAFAFVDLDNEREQRCVIQTLSDTTDEQFDEFDFTCLVQCGEDLRVAAKNDRNLKKYGRHKKEKFQRQLKQSTSQENEEHEPKTSARKIKKRQSQGKFRYVRGKSSPRPGNNSGRNSPEVAQAEEGLNSHDLLESLRPAKTYQELWLENLHSETDPVFSQETELQLPEVDGNLEKDGKSSNESVGNSSRGSLSDFGDVRHYVKGERVGNESRTLEFKARTNGRLAKKVLKKTIAKYVVAFLNSKGGTLMLGVDDDGIVIGRDYSSREEDLMRQLIDDVIRSIQPIVPPQVYQVEFVAVVVDGKMGPCKVLEISVQQGTTEQLYMTKQGEIFVRRDGSVQGPLRPAEVQQWTQGTYSHRLRANQTTIDQLRHQQAELRDELANHERRESELEALMRRRENSKVCIIL